MKRCAGRLVAGAVVMLVLLALYSFAGTDDQIPPLTAKQQAGVVDRWRE